MSIRIISISILLIIQFSCKKEKNSPLPKANFFVEILDCAGGECDVKLFDNSENAVSWEWKVEGEIVSVLKNYLISLSAGESYSVQLKVNNSDGIEAVKVKVIVV